METFLFHGALALEGSNDGCHPGDISLSVTSETTVEALGRNPEMG